MRQRFFTSTAQTRLIKNILANTPIPIYDTVRPGDYIIKNCKYVYNTCLIKCTKSGIVEEDGEFLTLNYSFYWGVDQLNHTERLRDATGFYDSKVHEWLGRYLRAYRDIVGINLMPFYNCFSGVYTSRFKLLTTSYVNSYVNPDFTRSVQVGNKVTVYEADQSYDTYSQGSEQFNSTYVQSSPYKILQIPIKLNRTYTIAVDCDSVVKVAPAFISHGHLTKVAIGTQKLDLTEILINNSNEQDVISPISIEKTNTVFIEPFTITINSKNQTTVEGITTEEDVGITYEQLLQRYEKYLYLLIQLPRENTSSVVVLEGDYTDISREKVFSLENIDKLLTTTYDDVQTTSSYILESGINSDPTISELPYVAAANIEGLQFGNNKLISDIISIDLNDYGYLEFNPKQGTYDYFVQVDPSTPGAIETQPGDVTLDGNVEAADATLVSQYIQGTVNNFNAQQLFNADVNRDGVINSADVNMIGRIAAKMISKPAKVYIKAYTGSYNLINIYSYVPLPEGLTFTVKYKNPVSTINTYVDNSLQENDVLLDKVLLSKLSLLQFNDGKNYPFADRLIEYLTLNVIDSADEISDNVKRAQDYFGVVGRKYSTYGAWNNYLRITAYLRTIRDRTLTHLDNNGYIDKTVESLMQSQRGD